MDRGFVTNGLTHFKELRKRINVRLDELQTRHAEEQKQYTWLYGAIGVVPSDVMFVCENPSLTGVERAHDETIDGGDPDIEAQWWGGRNNPAARRFRRVLCDLGLKTTPPSARGGWQCYITNVVKEANYVNEQNQLDAEAMHAQSEAWADILKWEYSKVQPRYVFAVGHKSAAALHYLQHHGSINNFHVHRIWHYSAPYSHRKVIDKMTAGIELALNPH
jgi:hypothetical protein